MIAQEASSARGWTAPQARPLLLAAIAEAGVIAVVAHLLLDGSGAIDVGLPVFAAVFAPVFTAAVMVMWRFADATSAPVAMAVAWVVLGVALGAGRLPPTVTAVAVCLLAAARVATLALQDWREASGVAFAVGGIVAGLEALAAGGAQRSWGATLVVAIPVFFGASLASRAAIAWNDAEDDVAASEARLDVSWMRRPWRLAALTGSVALVAITLGGTIDRLAGWLAPLGRAVATVVLAIVSQLVRPLFAVFERLDANTEGASELIERIRRSAEANTLAAAERPDPNSGGGGLSRVLALLFLVALVVVAIRTFRRFRRVPTTTAPLGHATLGHERADLPEAAERSAPSLRRRRELPHDAVRRAYLEALQALAARGFAKARDVTPAEFERTIAASHPALAVDLSALTRAYEDVRYGAATFTGASLEALERHRRSLLSALRHIPPALQT